MGNSSYRNELDAALQRAESLEKQNAALQNENQQLRTGQTPPRKPNVALALGIVGSAVFCMGLAAFLVLASKPAAVHQAAVATAPPVERTELARQALNALRPALSVCTTGLSHSITVSVTFEPNGSVSHAQAMPPAELTPVGQCVARVVHTARMQPFVGGPFTLMHPFIL